MLMGLPMNNVAEKGLERAKDKGYMAQDPFLTKYTANVTRPRIKVSITHGSDFPDFGGRCQLYCVVSVPGAPKSRLSTPVDYQYWGNPVWNFVDKQIWGWLPGKSLVFEVKNKAIKEGLVLFSMGEDESVGTASLSSEIFYPDGWKGKLEIHDSENVKVGDIYVEVFAFTGKPDRGCCASFWHQVVLACTGSGSAMTKLVKTIPTLLGELGEEVQLILGPEYPPRLPGEKWSSIMPAFVAFFFIYGFFNYVGLFRHHTIAALFELLVLVGFIAYLCSLLSGNLQGKGVGAPPSVKYGILLCSCVLSYMLAHNGWSEDWCQWWWMFTGWKTSGTASTPAASNYDASSIDFGNTLSTSVDANRAAGYRIGGSIYCVAPIMDPAIVDANIPLINYWAIGIDCCDDFGSFTCDNSRNYQGGVGVAMVPKNSLIAGERGFPCAGCNHDYFSLAI
jgi:hypothetical protein